MLCCCCLSVASMQPLVSPLLSPLMNGTGDSCLFPGCLMVADTTAGECSEM